MIFSVRRFVGYGLLGRELFTFITVIASGGGPEQSKGV